MSLHHNPTGKIEWPSLFSTVLVGVFCIVVHCLATIARHEPEPFIATHPVFMLLLGAILGYIPLDIDRPTADADMNCRVVAHARLVKVPLDVRHQLT